jgi:polar amino acid transport system substrate-binding protein
VLTVATDDPVYEPWFEDNTPSNGKGYESAVAYEVGSLLGFDHKQVKWVTEPFDSSYAPGPKRFDFDINEISVTPARAKVVSFSISYYNTTQSIVALRSNAIVTKHTPRPNSRPTSTATRSARRARLHLRPDPPDA